MIADDDFVKFCRDNYITPVFNRAEFDNDLNKLVILKKMFRRYVSTGNLNERLVINNFIILINVFGVEAANIIIFYRLEEEYYPIIKSVLLYLNVYRENPITKSVLPSIEILELLTMRL